MLTTPYTELEAVNLILRNDGEATLASLDELGLDEAADAQATLRDVSLAVQSDGWSFNTDFQRKFTPNVDGEIVLPNDTLWVRPTYRSARKQLVERGRKLYDLDNNSYSFNGPIYLDVCSMMDWQDLPAAARVYIAVRAAREYQADSTGSAKHNSFTETDEMRAEATFRRADRRTRPRGFFRNPVNARMLIRRPI